jgi:AraC family transcriptional regulator, ethanolamine operon transcriptional activator
MLRITASDTQEFSQKASSFMDVECRQLRPGSSRCELTIVSLGPVVVATGHLEQQLLLRLGIARGCMTVSRPGNGSGPVVFRGSALAPDECFVSGLAAETELINLGLWHPCMLRINIEQLREGYPWLDLFIHRPKNSVRAHHAGIQWNAAFLHSIAWVVQAIEEYQEATSRADVRASLADALLARVNLLGAASAPLRETRSERISRRIAVQRAREYIDRNLSESIRLSDLCKYARAQARSLEYGFREMVGMSPVAYIRAIRLHKARQLLQSSEVLTHSISQIALDCGFWHLSQFAVDYKRLFGESPSVTIRRTKAGLQQPPRRTNHRDDRSRLPIP